MSIIYRNYLNYLDVKEEIDIIKSSGVFGVPFGTDYTTSLKQFKKVWKLKVIQGYYNIKIRFKYGKVWWKTCFNYTFILLISLIYLIQLVIFNSLTQIKYNHIVYSASFNNLLIENYF